MTGTNTAATHEMPPTPARVLWCLKRTGTERAAEETPDTDDATREQPRRVYRCRACDTEVAEHDDVTSIGGRPSTQVHSNPHGMVYEIVTLAAARNVFLIGEPTSQFTWFPGYAWEIAYCVRCSVHLGWRFSGVGPRAEPETFYGLLVDRLH